MNKRASIATATFTLGLLFGVLLLGGYLMHRERPPIPAEIVGDEGRVLFTGSDVLAGQNHYFSRGGQHIGSIWGHGAYLAPDWSADYLHRAGLFLAARFRGLSSEQASRFTQADLDGLPPPERARLTALVAGEIKANRYDPVTRRLRFTPFQTEAHEALTGFYTRLFREGNERMGLQAGIVRTDEEGRTLATFFAWLAWAAGTNRPGEDCTYTSNWPFDPLVGNQPLPGTLIWSIVSVVLLILGIAASIFVYQRYIHEDDYFPGPPPALEEPDPSPGRKALLAYFLTAAALLVVQTLLGSATAHFTVEGTRFFGLSLGRVLPYAAARTWHVQLGVFFIATCFLAAGLYIAARVGKEPRGHAALVRVLFIAVVAVVVGALAGTWLSTQGFLGGDGFWLGHQGYEYIELGRLWQLLLTAGMVVWLVLVLRAIRPALAKEQDVVGLTHLLLYSAVSIPVFYAVGLLYGKGSHLSDAEFWRWWVVHLWVEGFFEVFATVFMAFILTRIGVLPERTARRLVHFTVFLYLGSGVVGTFHHLYWTGSPTPIYALGAVFSALEIVPLSLVGFEVVRYLRAAKTGGAENPYRWPLYFFASVAFWNLVGAGLFGFLINPPAVLYYIQGINTTTIHSHTALFGVYGMLAISLALFSIRGIVPQAAWSDRMLRWSFWGLNGGLAAMTVFSLAPAGFYQFYFAVRDGLWYARSPEVTSGGVMRALAWARLLPDLVFIAGALFLLGFVFRAARWTIRTRQTAGK